ncbi:hypothetical protein FLL45_18735 [Aliikangiella marina]|uniref:DUF306 domain-containing protein n=1 Tax=Aliikangiella marina TaxID=1712262 RepID=A0A545T4W5_9GAMM|nr:DUF6174 domain-containing protein [Aliikangiella marina]TQV72256.1 hypothetical protein FLL45_18735 [Aliikangiella marina]
MRTTYHLFFVVILATILLSGCDENDLVEDNLNANSQDLYELYLQNKAGWVELNATDYDFEFTIDCFCGIAGQYSVSVRNKNITTIFRNASGVFIEAELFAQFYTIDDLFEQIQLAFDQDRQLSLGFDQTLYYPTLIIIDEDLIPVDGGYTMTTSNLLIIN